MTNLDGFLFDDRSPNRHRVQGSGMTTSGALPTETLQRELEERAIVCCCHCGQPVLLQREGGSLRGHCQQCTQRLRGSLPDSDELNMVYLPDIDCYLSVRGC